MNNFIRRLRQRANLYRNQQHPGTNFFDQIADTIEKLHRENIRLKDELQFSENMVKLLGEIELVEQDLSNTTFVGMTDDYKNYPAISKMS